MCWKARSAEFGGSESVEGDVKDAKPEFTTSNQDKHCAIDLLAFLEGHFERPNAGAELIAIFINKRSGLGALFCGGDSIRQFTCAN